MIHCSCRVQASKTLICLTMLHQYAFQYCSLMLNAKDDSPKMGCVAVLSCMAIARCTACAIAQTWPEMPCTACKLPHSVATSHPGVEEGGSCWLLGDIPRVEVKGRLLDLCARLPALTARITMISHGMCLCLVYPAAEQVWQVQEGHDCKSVYTTMHSHVSASGSSPCTCLSVACLQLTLQASIRL